MPIVAKMMRLHPTVLTAMHGLRLVSTKLCMDIQTHSFGAWRMGYILCHYYSIPSGVKSTGWKFA